MLDINRYNGMEDSREGFFPLIPVGFLPFFVGNAARVEGKVSVLEPDPLASAFSLVLISPSSTSSVSKSMMVHMIYYDTCIVN